VNNLQRSLFSFEDIKFTFYESPSRPQWRSPQRGALGALMAHWSLPRGAPALVSLPTGSGKSAVALAAPFLASAKRVLVVVPSKDLRRQLAGAFSDLALLHRIDAVDYGGAPRVHELVHRIQDWRGIEQYEVVVAAPGTISPVHYPESPPPADLFDLVVIDEAHHSPAPTWRAILEHFTAAKALLLTATPRRLDGQRLPGEHIYHYPLRQALEERIFKPIQPILLSGPWTVREDTDRALVAKTVDIVTSAEHATSTLLVRAASQQRAVELAGLYREAGITIEVLHSGLGPRRQTQIVDDLRAGRLRAVSVIGMLVEGFDLPSLRILAYHDKHKSLPATAQIIGRLARVDDTYPQPSVLIAARDIDVFPELHGVVRTLYGEDPDWATILPGIIDDQVATDLANHNYARQFGDAPPDLSLDAVQPLRRAVIHELTARRSKEPRAFEDGVLPEALTAGKTLRGKNILYSSLNPAGTTLMIVTESNERPKWHAAPGLDTPGYQLHLVSRRNAPRTDRRDLLIVNVEDQWVGREIFEQIGVRNQHNLADPAQLEAVFDSLERRSVSSVGLRNDYGGTTGTTSYRMYHGKGVDRGLREADTAYGSLGHAMIQVDDDGTSFTAGVATAKSKYWETRYSPLLDYEAFVDDLAERYWFPPGAVTGQLLPQVNRGRRLTDWPAAMPIAVELDPALIGMGWTIDDIGPLDELDFQAEQPHGNTLDINAVVADGERRVIWTASLDVTGEVKPHSGDLVVRRGYGVASPLSELLIDRPLTIFFGNGDTVHGTVIVNSRTRSHSLPPLDYNSIDWSDVDLKSETPKTAKEKEIGLSVQEKLETYLKNKPRRGRHRWIVHNDGRGEFADYIVIEVDRDSVSVELWHAKAAGGKSASVRVTDLQEVVAQAIKSRRWITDPAFWSELGNRLTGHSTPTADVRDGTARQLLVLCGQAERAEGLSFTRSRPVVTGTVAIVQPGLSYRQLRSDLDDDALSAVQIRDLLAVFHDSVSQVASPAILCSDYT
jgi:superfamily II DNA or RNA helicase